ncbi:hypothetical protein DV737_g4615, partial [Chaetothyriales sp. CBS 132003]
MDIQTWHGLLESHHSLLNKHVETLGLMQQNLQDGSDAAQMLESCVNQTETALQAFKLAAYRFMAELHSQALPQPTQSNGPTAPTAPAVGGVSGPTPAEQAQQSQGVRRTLIGTKRRAAAEESPPAQPPISFTSPIEAKLKEKEEKMWKRMVKKRKRSPSDTDGVSQEQTKSPLLAKLRKKSLLAATKAGGDSIEQSAPKSQPGKQSSDLSSRTAGHVEQNLPRAGGKKDGTTRRKGRVTA